MILRNTPGVNRHFRPGWMNKLIIPLVSLITLSGLLITPVSAQDVSPTSATQDIRPDNAVGYYIKDGQTYWLYEEDVDTFPEGTTPGQIEAMYPMSPEAEKAIVHEIPECPVVIIDGIKYDSKDISLFNGVRLRFTTDDNGNLYAFTTAQGWSNFKNNTLRRGQ